MQSHDSMISHVVSFELSRQLSSVMLDLDRMVASGKRMFQLRLYQIVADDNNLIEKRETRCDSVRQFTIQTNKKQFGSAMIH